MTSALVFQPDEYYPTISTKLLAAVPEFVTVFDVDDPADIYLVIGEFSRFLIASHTNPTLFQRCMDFINKSFELGGQETQDMLWVQVFESVDDHKEVLPQFASHLSPYIRTLFEAYQQACIETRNRFLKQGQ
ncbi:hypothetical protein GO988_22925 [Hymenobacter sp. HMF4947]|uniref:DUF7674 domain-containing protein n=1 Tax=Hymenobacter ginkgonis TaxID=2682976 RepID=A0A7K1TLB9_9BACT|nr:hypothetical protein [Hymenobacter ginkgonis]MVN79195.1 hypothetical protein [Hymenobacter ginkgonis]